jgi:hypothetical protein
MGDVFGQTKLPLDCLLAAHATLGTCSAERAGPNRDEQSGPEPRERHRSWIHQH